MFGTRYFAVNDVQNYLEVKRTKPYYNLIRRIRFPSSKLIYERVFVVVLIGGITSFLIVNPSIEGLLKGLIYGLLGVASPLLVGAVFSHKITGNDPLLTFRRCLALALFSSVIWGFAMILGATLSRVYSSFRFPIHTTLLAVFLVTPLRTLAVNSISSQSLWRKLSTSFIEPAACLVAANLLLGLPIIKVLQAFILTTGLSTSYTLLLRAYIELRGRRQLGISPSELFKGFLIEWLEKKNEVVEGFLEELSTEDIVRITIIKFRDITNKSLKAALAIANYHPGPLLNIGSSTLPSNIQKVVMDKFRIPIITPHGISGHDRNLVSQVQNAKVISKIVELLESKSYWGRVTEPVEAIYGSATSRCQVFSKCALVTLTRAPEDMEDIPPKVEDEVIEYSKGIFEHSALVDAHNSISKETVLAEKDLEDLTQAAKLSIKYASERPELPFQIGIAEIDLRDYELKHGIGHGSGYVCLINVDGKPLSYVVIDGNNMVRGLREDIHNALEAAGITPVETMTTDTHAVNGVVSADLGYFPVGAVISYSELIGRIVDAVRRAEESMVEAETSYTTDEVKVKTLGLALFSKLAASMYSMSKVVAASVISIIVLSLYILLLTAS